MYYLGIDGCGKYTKLLMLDGNGKVLGRHSGAAADLRYQPAASVARNIAVLTREIGKLTNTGIKECGGLCFAAPASLFRAAEEQIAKIFKDMGYGCEVLVVSVERAALAAKKNGELRMGN